MQIVTGIPCSLLPRASSPNRLSICKARFGRALLIVLSLALPAAAQDTAPSESSAPKTLAAALGQIPTDPEAAAKQAEFLAKNVPAPPLPAGSTDLDALRERANNLQKQRAQYLQDIASGKAIPQAHLRETLPQRMDALKALALSLGEMEAETDPGKKQLLSKAFFAALQPIGSFLEIADVGKGYVNLLSEQQQAELTRLGEAWDAADRDYGTKAKSLHIFSPGQLYTITGLSVPIIVQAPPSSKVIFQTFGGGFFSNKLALIEVEANKEGFAQAEWVSYGDSVGDTVIGVRSKAAPPAANLTITSVKLELSPLPELPKQLPSAPAVPKIETPGE